MRSRCVAAVLSLLVAPVFALDGETGMHDPSTVIESNGKFDVYAARFLDGDDQPVKGIAVSLGGQ